MAKEKKKLEFETFPKLLKRRYLEHGTKKTALRKKRYGIWRSYSWSHYYENVKLFALGLLSLGFERRENVAILGDNDPEWWYAALATQCLGGVEYGIFVDCGPSEVKYFILRGEATFVVVKDQEQIDKLLEIKAEIPQVKKFIYWEPKGMEKYDDSHLIEFKDVIALGKEYEKTHPNLFDECVEKTDLNDTACFCFTSGTTGNPKPAVITYYTMIKWLEFPHNYWSLEENWDYFSFLCPAWLTDQWLGICGALIYDWVVNFPEEPETVKDDAREICGQFQFGGARAWEELNRNIQSNMIDADFIKRFCYKLFLPVGLRVADLLYENKKPGLFLRAAHQLGEWLIFGPLRDHCGVKRTQVCNMSGSTMSPELTRYWRAMGVPLYSMFGLTETGTIAIEEPDHLRYGSTGKVVKEREIKISEEGEILIKKDEYIFSGYYKSPEEDAKTIRDGWFHTGDCGYIDDDNFLFFVDRISELSALSDGNKFSPTYIEANLRFSTYIKDAMVIGAGRDFVSVLIDIDLGNCSKFAEKHRVAYTTRVDLAQKSEIIELIKKEIQEVNRKAPEHSRIRKFVNLHKEFDPDEAEMTRTRKIKRKVLEDKYKEIVDAIYHPSMDKVHVRTEVQYRDGRKGTIDTNIAIASIEN